MLISIVMWFLIMYGLINIVLDIWKSLWINEEKNNTYVIAFFKNQEDTVEGVVKSLIYKNIYMDKFRGIIAIDMDSADDTKRILENLARENDYLLVF